MVPVPVPVPPSDLSGIRRSAGRLRRLRRLRQAPSPPCAAVERDDEAKRDDGDWPGFLQRHPPCLAEQQPRGGGEKQQALLRFPRGGLEQSRQPDAAEDERPQRPLVPPMKY